MAGRAGGRKVLDREVRLCHITDGHLFLSISYFPRMERNKATDEEERGLLGWGSWKQLLEGLLVKFHPLPSVVPS